MYYSFNQEKSVQPDYQFEKTVAQHAGNTRFPVQKSYLYKINKGQSRLFDLTVAQYLDVDGKPRQAIICPAHHTVNAPVMSQNDLRARAWEQVSEALGQHSNEQRVFLTWWDNAQRLDLMTGQPVWIKQPVSAMFINKDEQYLWSSIAGGFDENYNRVKQLADWLLMDADQAIDNISKVVESGLSPYLLLSIDDLARLQELENLTEKKLAIESRVFYTSENIHTMITKVKQWAKADGTGNYLLQPMPGVGVRAWRILDQTSEKTLFVRLLPFTHSLEQPLSQVEQVFQSEWGGYISIFKLR